MAMEKNEIMRKFFNQPPLTFKQSGIKWLWLTLIIIFVDQLSKYLAVEYLAHQTIEVMPYFNLILRYNEGAAFSFLADAGGWQVYFLGVLASGVSIAILVWLYMTPASNRRLSIGLALILGGAVGNLIDRVRLGKVVDFIDWYYPANDSCLWGFFMFRGDCHWPAFNVADGVILLGAIVLVVDSFLSASSNDDDADRQK